MAPHPGKQNLAGRAGGGEELLVTFWPCFL